MSRQAQDGPGAGEYQSRRGFFLRCLQLSSIPIDKNAPVCCIAVAATFGAYIEPRQERDTRPDGTVAVIQTPDYSLSPGVKSPVCISFLQLASLFFLSTRRGFRPWHRPRVTERCCPAPPSDFGHQCSRAGRLRRCCLRFLHL